MRSPSTPSTDETRTSAFLAIAVVVMAACSAGGAPAGTPSSGAVTGFASATASSSGGPSPSSPTGPPPSSTASAHTSPVPTPPATTISQQPPPYPPTLTGRDVERSPTPRRLVALTFDVGADAAGLTSILATLGHDHVPATFFLTGSWSRPTPRVFAASPAQGTGSPTTPPPMPTCPPSPTPESAARS